MGKPDQLISCSQAHKSTSSVTAAGLKKVKKLLTIVAIVAIIYVYQQYERYKTMNRIYQTKNVRDPNDNNLSFDIDRLWANNFKIEVTQNYEDSGMWNVCAFDNNGDFFGSYNCKNEKGVLDIIREISKEEMEEENESY